MLLLIEQVASLRFFGNELIPNSDETMSENVVITPTEIIPSRPMVPFTSFIRPYRRKIGMKKELARELSHLFLIFLLCSDAYIQFHPRITAARCAASSSAHMVDSMNLHRLYLLFLNLYKSSARSSCRLD